MIPGARRLQPPDLGRQSTPTDLVRACNVTTSAVERRLPADRGRVHAAFAAVSRAACLRPRGSRAHRPAGSNTRGECHDCERRAESRGHAGANRGVRGRVGVDTTHGMALLRSSSSGGIGSLRQRRLRRPERRPGGVELLLQCREVGASSAGAVVAVPRPDGLSADARGRRRGSRDGSRPPWSGQSPDAAPLLENNRLRARRWRRPPRPARRFVIQTCSYP